MQHAQLEAANRHVGVTHAMIKALVLSQCRAGQMFFVLSLLVLSSLAKPISAAPVLPGGIPRILHQNYMSGMSGLQEAAE